MAEKEQLLENIMIYQFCAVELNLFLDNFPDNKEAAADYKRVSEKLKEAKMHYEDSYGPLCNFGSSYCQNPEKWINTPWPWENKEV